jgi:hypothetical protein
VSRLVWLLAVFAFCAAALVVGLAMDVEWNDRAASSCNQESEKPAGAASAAGYSIRWEWTEFAYVCRYHAPGEPAKRVGFTNAFR